MFNTFAPKMSN